MNMSKRLALLGARSALSLARRQGLGSSYRRPFSYRQISELTKDSNQSKQSQEHHSTVMQHDIEKLRGEMEKMQIELRSVIENTTNKLSREIGAVNSEVNESSIRILVSLLAVVVSVVFMPR
ncbi:hypothetical protein ISN44_As08g035430 [Arabidopsis suecica]|uniref:Uncharacterized protein n=1 Tax=Arabidopsis suecica TaxID=45249 RepID=A0A8T2BBX0_ARASU|nr:hypothetical protein ISN44_As08g035430 [Arabidopsis suecica]